MQLSIQFHLATVVAVREPPKSGTQQSEKAMKIRVYFSSFYFPYIDIALLRIGFEKKQSIEFRLLYFLTLSKFVKIKNLVGQIQAGFS